jgi:hypothetical protein
MLVIARRHPVLERMNLANDGAAACLSSGRHMKLLFLLWTRSGAAISPQRHAPGFVSNKVC